MKWEIRWKVLADAITDLRRSGEIIPFTVINDLRSAKTMLEILKVDESRPENISRLEEYLNNVETQILPMAKDRFGEAYVNNMLRRMYGAEMEEAEGEVQIRFHPNLPREERWIRVQVTDEMPLETIKKMAREGGLNFRVEENGYVLIYGKDEKIKEFVKKAAETLHNIKEN